MKNLKSVSPRLLILAAIALSSHSVFADDLDKRAIDPIAIIFGDLSGKPTFGAGIVFALDRDSLYVVTANHLVRKSGMTADNLGVRLRSAPSRNLPARIQATFDTSLDLAVLKVENLGSQGVDACSLSLDRLPEPGVLTRGDPVYPVGNPNNLPWRVPPRSDAISEITGDQIEFESQVIAQGHSGGALINASGQLVGMIQADEPPYGRALGIYKIIRALQAWQYSIDLDVHDRGGPIHDAVRSNRLDELRKALGGPCLDLERIDHRDATPLAEASALGWSQAVDLLLRAGADPDGKKGKAIPLIEAMTHDHGDVARVLLANGSDPNRGSPVTVGVETADANILLLLLKRGAKLEEALPPKTDTGGARGSGALLYFAVAHDNMEVANLLLEHGANPSGPVLSLAITTHRTALSKTLLAHGADVNLGSPLTPAVEAGDAEILRRLLLGGARIDLASYPKSEERSIMMGNGAALLFFAITHKDFEVVKLLVEYGASPNGGTISQGNLLTIAGWSSTPEIVEFLLRKGAKLDKVGSRSNGTALHGAVVQGSLQMTKTLVDAGSDLQAISMPPIVGDTPIGLAYIHLKSEGTERRAILDFLLTCDRTTPQDRMHVVTLALNDGNSELAKQILLMKVSPKTVRGDQPLNGAIDLGDVGLVEQLVEIGIDVNAPDSRGATPLLRLVQTDKFSAVDKCHVLKLLLDLGARGNYSQEIEEKIKSLYLACGFR